MELRNMLSSHGFNFSKSMGQNFLIDDGIPGKIARLSGIDKSCGVLEVGPGIGALTKKLSEAAGHVTAVELDKRLIPILTGMLADNKNITIIQGDILKLDIAGLANKTMNDLGLTPHVCANLPYNITTPVITAFIEAEVFKSITIMIQKEVAERICAKPGSKEYGAFTVYANYHSEPEILFDVPPECFMPRPKVTSSVVKMQILSERKLSGDSEKLFFKVVRAAFGQRRKTLANALYAVFDKTHTKDEIIKIIENSGFDSRIRGEVLSIDEFIKLSSGML